MQADVLPSEPSGKTCNIGDVGSISSWGWGGGGGDPLKKEVATHSSIFAWEIPRTEESGRLQSKGGVAKELDMS